jgi:hypothetical protein
MSLPNISAYYVYPIIKALQAAKSEKEVESILRKNVKSLTLIDVLLATYGETEFGITVIPNDLLSKEDDVHKVDSIEQYRKRLPIFVLSNFKRNGPTVTQRLRELIRFMHVKELEVLACMFKKDLKIPHISKEIMNSVWPGMFAVQESPKVVTECPPMDALLKAVGAISKEPKEEKIIAPKEKAPRKKREKKATPAKEEVKTDENNQI